MDGVAGEGLSPETGEAALSIYELPSEDGYKPNHEKFLTSEGEINEAEVKRYWEAIGAKADKNQLRNWRGTLKEPRSGVLTQSGKLALVRPLRFDKTGKDQPVTYLDPERARIALICSQEFPAMGKDSMFFPYAHLEGRTATEVGHFSLFVMTRSDLESIRAKLEEQASKK